MKKISIILFLIFLLIGFSFAQKKNTISSYRYYDVPFKIFLDGETSHGVPDNLVLPNIKNILRNQIKDGIPQYNVSFTYTGCSTIYDFTSNAIPQNIIQDPSNPDRIHIVCMYAPPGDGTYFPNRITKYYYSTNKGTSWTFICNVPDVRSGFPCITLTSNGNALIANHGGTPTIPTWYYDAAPGLGNFEPLTHSATMDYTHPRTVATNNILLTNKFVGLVSPSGRDSAFITIAHSLTPPGNFSYWDLIPADQGETYSIEKGVDGRIGIIYRNNGVLNPSDIGSLFFMESTDNGTTFSTPLKIFYPDLSQTGDSLSTLRGMQICYQGNSPKVIFEAIKSSQTGYFSNSGKNQIRFWSNNLPGTDPYRSIVIADSSNIGFHSYLGLYSTYDIFTNICRPTIGSSIDGTGLFVAFIVPSGYAGGSTDTVSFMDVYFTYSVNYGLNWVTPAIITPSTPRRDWTYPCLSPYNDNTSSSYFANILMLSDSIPGSYLYHTVNGESNAKYMVARVEIPRSIPPAPVLKSPPNGSYNQPRNPNMKWYPVNNAVTYRIQITIDTLFMTILYDSANIVNTNLQLAHNLLSPGTKYYWRVNASNSSGSGPWSTAWSFSVDTAQFYSIAGTIRYKDNNQIATGGYVKALKINTQTLEIRTLDSAVIQSDGSYVLGSVRSETDVRISPYPNSTPPNDNFVPTYYPSEILWERATPLNVNANLTNINIGVYRIANAFSYYAIEGKIFRNPNPTLPLNDAVIYAKKDSQFYRFAISNSAGYYRLSYLVPATYKLYISRLGYRSDSSIVDLVIGQYENFRNYTLVPFYTGINKNENIIPTEFNLYQNYPNPFNPSSKIKFDVPKVSNVVLKIYDLTGREIAKLVNSTLQPGIYETTWDATTFASGLYFLRMEAGTYTSTKKMMFIK